MEGVWSRRQPPPPIGDGSTLVDVELGHGFFTHVAPRRRGERPPYSRHPFSYYEPIAIPETEAARKDLDAPSTAR